MYIYGALHINILVFELKFEVLMIVCHLLGCY